MTPTCRRCSVTMEEGFIPETVRPVRAVGMLGGERPAPWLPRVRAPFMVTPRVTVSSTPEDIRDEAIKHEANNAEATVGEAIDSTGGRGTFHATRQQLHPLPQDAQLSLERDRPDVHDAPHAVRDAVHRTCHRRGRDRRTHSCRRRLRAGKLRRVFGAHVPCSGRLEASVGLTSTTSGLFRRGVASHPRIRPVGRGGSGPTGDRGRGIRQCTRRVPILRRGASMSTRRTPRDIGCRAPDQRGLDPLAASRCPRSRRLHPGSARRWMAAGRECRLPSRLRSRPALTYDVGCDAAWRTTPARLEGVMGATARRVPRRPQRRRGLDTHKRSTVQNLRILYRCRSRLHPCDQPLAAPPSRAGCGSGKGRYGGVAGRDSRHPDAVAAALPNAGRGADVLVRGADNSLRGIARSRFDGDRAAVSAASGTPRREVAVRCDTSRPSPTRTPPNTSRVPSGCCVLRLPAASLLRRGAGV